MQLQEIGTGHPAVKDVLNIQRNTAPNRFQLVVAEGLWAAKVALDLNVRIDRFFYCPELVRSTDAKSCAVTLADQARRSYEVSAKTMKRMAERDGPDGLLALVEMPKWESDSLGLSESALVVVTDGMEIPGNLGTLLRTADAVNAEALVMTNRKTRMSHPKVFRGSHGMSLKVPHLEFEEVIDAIRWLERNKFRVHLADTDDSVNYRRIDYSGRTAIVLGSERFGLSREWYEHEHARVGIPMLGVSDSLNVSVSASILLYEARAHKDGW